MKFLHWRTAKAQLRCIPKFLVRKLSTQLSLRLGVMDGSRIPHAPTGTGHPQTAPEAGSPFKKSIPQSFTAPASTSPSCFRAQDTAMPTWSCLGDVEVAMAIRQHASYPQTCFTSICGYGSCCCTSPLIFVPFAALRKQSFKECEENT